jgi:fatty acid desaturase
VIGLRRGWSRLAIGVHLLVVALASWQLAAPHAKPVYALWAIVSGTSLFVLTGLVHEASHHLLSRSPWLNEAAGNLAGWIVLTPLSAYRAFHLKHHQTTNREGDPNAPLNSRWMLAVGALVYPFLIHRYAWKNLRGRLLGRYVVEMVGMFVCLPALYLLLPRALRERAWLLPLGVVAVLQNIRIVTEHLDLPSGRYHDTWQLALPRWLSRWLLHYDHHLEHHLRPGLHWHELPDYRAELIAREPGLGLHCVTLGSYFRDVFFQWSLPSSHPSTARSGPAAAKQAPDEGPGIHHRLRVDAAGERGSGGGSQSQGPRYHGLDALRAVTMVLVVVLHAALAYTQVPIPNLIWVVRDPATHPALDVLCWWTLGISSPFYLLGGFFAAELTQARGLRAFLVNRVKRILGPFLVAGVTILPATFFVWVCGWVVSGLSSPREILRMKFHAKGLQRNLYGPAHLWSLEYLALMLAAFGLLVALHHLLRRRISARPDGRERWWDRGLASPWRPLLLAVPTTLILWAGHRQVGLDAILDRMNSFTPEPFRLLHNAVFFAVGVSLHRLRGDLGRLAVHRWTYLALSIPVFAFRALLIRGDLSRSLEGPPALALAATGALFTWLLTFGLLGLALGTFHRPRPAVRYLADSSYWVYLVHLPIIGLLQVDLYFLPAPAAVKFLVVLAVTIALCLASYHVMVRHTLLGIWLHGRRERTRAESRSRPHTTTSLMPSSPP